MTGRIVLALCALALAAPGCGGDETPTSEPGNFSEFVLVNSTTRDLRVRIEPSGGTTTVVVGAEARLFIAGGTYTEFRVPSEVLTCVSAIDAATGALVYQQMPVVDAAWEKVRGAVRAMHFSLVLTDSDLSEGSLVDGCGGKPRE